MANSNRVMNHSRGHPIIHYPDKMVGGKILQYGVHYEVMTAAAAANKARLQSGQV
jgi:hypothetical protein